MHNNRRHCDGLFVAATPTLQGARAAGVTRHQVVRNQKKYERENCEVATGNVFSAARVQARHDDEPGQYGHGKSI